MYKTLTHTLRYENPWMKIWEDQIELPNGEKGIYGYMEKASHGVMIIPLTAENKVVIINEWRYPIKELSWGFPCGDIDPGESPEQAALRELKEETGATASGLLWLGELVVDPGYNTQAAAVFLAKDVELPHQGSNPEGEELRVVSLTELEAMIKKGDVNSSWTLAGLTKLRVFLSTRAS